MSDKSNNNLDEYVARQTESYYGSNKVQSISHSVPPPPPKKRPNKWHTLAAALCAVAFLTGAIMITGVLLTSRIPHSEIDSDNNISDESTASSDGSISSNFTKNTDHDISSKSDTSSNIDTSSKSDTSSNIDTSSKSDTSSNIDTSSKSDTSSNIDTSSKSDQNSSSENSSSRRVHEDILTETDEHTDFDISMESEPLSPNGSVTTGRDAQIGVGIFLMLASFGGATTLFKEKTS